MSGRPSSRSTQNGSDTANRPLIATLRSAAGSMSPALARIADAVLAQPDVAVYQSVTELAEAAQSSEASVIRFCREQGFAGFQDFKLALARELAMRAAAEEPAKPTDAVQQLVDTAFQALRETAHLLDRSSLDRVASRISQARSIDIFGIAASAVTASYLEYKLTRAGLKSRAFSDAHLAMMAASMADKDCVQVIVSSSGTTIDAVRVAERAHAGQAFIVAITNRSRSPLASLSNEVLISNWPETPLTGGAYPSKISQLLIIDAILAHILALDPRRRDILDITAESVSDKNL